MKKIVISDTDYEKVMRYLKYASEAMVEEQHYELARSIKESAKAVKSFTKKSVRVIKSEGDNVFAVTKFDVDSIELEPNVTDFLNGYKVISNSPLKRGDIVGWTK